MDKMMKWMMGVMSLLAIVVLSISILMTFELKDVQEENETMKTHLSEVQEENEEISMRLEEVLHESSNMAYHIEMLESANKQEGVEEE